MSVQRSSLGRTMQEDCYIELPYFRMIRKRLKVLMERDYPVLIWGETGTGKSVLARYLHSNSKRSRFPFVEVHLQAIPATLIAAELFGHEKGAFTGAEKARYGWIKRAHRGSLFLDQVESLAFEYQACLLEILDTQYFSPLGSSYKERSDFRLFCASLENPIDLVSEGRLREDFYYRISGEEVHLPPLRERPEDLKVLIMRFWENMCRETGRKLTLTPDAWEQLLLHRWPGNIREVRSVLNRLICRSEGPWVCGEEVCDAIGRKPEEHCQLRDVLQAAERAHILKVYLATGKRIKRTARILGISRNTLRQKLREYGINGEKPEK